MAGKKLKPIPVWTSNRYLLAVGAMTNLLGKKDALEITVTPAGKGLHSIIKITAMVGGKAKASRTGATKTDPLSMLFSSPSAVRALRGILKKYGPGASVQYVLKKPLVDKLILLPLLADQPTHYKRALSWITKNLSTQMRLIIIRKDGTEKELGIGKNSVPKLTQLERTRRLAKA